MKVLITGTSQGIGRATAQLFLDKGHEVIGIDRQGTAINNKHYKHYIVDVTKKNKLPNINGVEILVNNAGTQNENDIQNNLIGAMNVTEKYGIQPDIKSVLMVSSASALSGAEFTEYCVSKGGLNAYGKNVASRIAQYGATCNNLCPGGVLTPMNQHIVDNEKMYQAVLDETMLKRWANPEEIAEWIYFLTITNKFMTAQDLLVDGGEAAKSNFIW